MRPCGCGARGRHGVNCTLSKGEEATEVVKKPRAEKKPARRKRAAAPAPPRNGAVTLLTEKLDEQINDTRAELRALERLRVSVTAGA